MCHSHGICISTQLSWLSLEWINVYTSSTRKGVKCYIQNWYIYICKWKENKCYVYIYPLHHLTYPNPLNDDVWCTNIYIKMRKSSKVCVMYVTKTYIFRITALTLPALCPMGYVSSLNIACCSFDESIYLHHKCDDHLCDVHNWCTYIVTLTSLSPPLNIDVCNVLIYIHAERYKNTWVM
jgi:hypothetical protein